VSKQTDPQSGAAVSRRQLLKAGAIVSGLVAVAGAADLGSAARASAQSQDLWTFCAFCRCMYYGYTASRGYGTCSASGGAHDYTGASLNYIFDVNGGGGQSGWRWCNKCCVMFYGGSGTTGGVCAYDGASHTGSSYNYHVYYEPDHRPVGAYQEGWRYCTSCAALAWKTNGSFYVECPATGHYHTLGSRTYDVGMTTG